MSKESDAFRDIDEQYKTNYLRSVAKYWLGRGIRIGQKEDLKKSEAR